MLKNPVTWNYIYWREIQVCLSVEHPKKVLENRSDISRIHTSLLSVRDLSVYTGDLQERWRRTFYQGQRNLTMVLN